MNLLTWPERLISRLTGENEEEKTMTEPTQTADIATASDTAAVADTPETAVRTADSGLSGNDTTATDDLEKHVKSLLLDKTVQPAQSVSLLKVDFEVLRGILAAIGYDIPRDKFESAVFLATSDTKAHG
ncbi:hypothetical protein ONE84_000875 [Salmonella enterica subsp. enterica serovar Newport]|uniref:Uncharacterized protein n=2 Tax=Salmonella enterica TaxID=28901 RepID=A0A5Y2FJ35_SALNE|nr:hypothetical protein [Salmonella enterica subsp. enterica serovar Newport]EJE2205268.1 hypothetical protein [Salmonella enterica subsp. enterica serovar Newport]EKB1678273.1 hypothetical protein [Salmonella enterica subsp. enterica serovar Newport]SUF69563.1 Uncharacterised protein [Salmonella enterica]SUI19771.1 Uncharacterised protein [Salmonella enterica subsp. salamae]